VNAAGLVVDIEHAPADHHGNKHCERDGAGQKIFHVLDVGIKLHDLQNGLLEKARLDGGLVQSLGDIGQFLLERRAHEVVAVVDDQRDLRAVLLVHAARILRRDNHSALDFSVANVVARAGLVVVVDGQEGAHVGAHRVESLPDLQRLRATILIDDTEARIFYLAAERIAQHDELHQRKNHGRQHQGGRAEELAHFALDNRHHPIHGLNPGACGMTKP
jgi:hypothetical protein